MMNLTHLLLALVSYCTAAPNVSPVFVRIDTDASKSFDLGPYDRTRFDLVEQFHPLQTASLAKGDVLQDLKRAEGVRLAPSKKIVEEDTNLFDSSSADDSSPEQIALPSSFPLRIAFGEWSAWSNWTPCMSGERSRVRSCSSKETALRTVCYGEAKEVQKCFSMVEAQIPVAEDPWTIEREITGFYKD